ncbi:MAG: amino acid adenylation domain-containing protein, partial [Gemmatimonadota bacterium]
PPAAGGREGGPAPLTPVQAWFFEQAVPDRGHWNMPLLLRARRPLDAAPLERALACVLARHRALHLRFTRGPGGAWEQAYAEPGDAAALRVVDLSRLAGPRRGAAVTSLSAELQRTLDLERGPLLRAAYFDLGAGSEPRLLLAAHHVAVDGVSWRVLLDDLAVAYGQAERGEAVDLGPAGTSYLAWARRLAEHARAGGFEPELAYWAAEERRGIPPLPLDFPGGANTLATARSVAVSLSAGETRALLQEVPAAYRTQVGDVLLCALATALAGWTGEERSLVQLEGHGREEVFPDVDLARTVGWFTTLYPVLLDLRGAHGPGERLKAVKEQLRAVPGRGLGYGALRYLGSAPAREALSGLPAARVHFEYHGQLDGSVSGESLFGLAPESPGPATSPAAEREHVLAVSGGVVDGALALQWSYSGALHRRETVEALAGRFLAALRELVAHCAAPGAGGYTPSDFALSGLGAGELEELLGAERGIEDVYPPTPMQEGMLFETQLASGHGVYVAQATFTLRGALDRGALRRAWDGVLERHSALRTAFPALPSRGVLQVVRRRATLPVREEDWSGRSAAERAAALEAYLRDDRARGFDPAVAPLMRVALLRTGEAEHVLVWSFHQMVLDGWSLPLVFRDLMALYAAACEGSEPRLEPVGAFREYVAWVRRQGTDAAERFWREALAGFTAPTPLELEAPDEGAPEGTGVVDLRLAGGVPAAVQAAARGRGLTVNTLVQGAWALLLSRYAGEDEVVFGTTVSGRPTGLEGVETLVGLFINTLPVRVRLRPEAVLGEWLQEVQAHNVAVREHEHTPLVWVQGWSEVPRGTPLFQSIVVFENYPVDPGAAASRGGLEVAAGAALEQGSHPLAVVAALRGELVVRVRYQRQRFGPGGVERLAEHLATVLEAVARDPEQPLGAVSLLRETERARVLEEWNATSAGFPRGRCIHEIFAERARLAPEAPAVRFGSERLTYAGLDAASNRLAHALRRRGAGPESRVGICLERGIDMVVAVLAVLKAGAAYLPLDPRDPAERLARLLRDAGASLVLARADHAGSFPDLPEGAPCLDLGRSGIDREPAHAVAAPADPQSLAYVIYTSGSTGTPKGVGVSHRSAVSHLWWVWREVLGADVRALPAISPLFFDASLKQVIGPLLHGGTVWMHPAEAASDPAALLRDLAGQDGLALNCVPSLWRMLLEQDGAQHALGGLRALLLGGEALPPDLVERTFERFPRLEVWNLYGPTETSVNAVAGRVERGRPVRIGRPVANARAYVLDREGRPVPAGVPGELYLGGAGVARGYLGRADLTAERFVPDALSGGRGERLYRTGDRVRWTAEGELEFLGRTDQQLKVRGIRVEPGEIEAALREHAAVREAAVVPREVRPGVAQLVAYVAARPGTAAGASELRAHLRERLPEHMVPAAFVAMERLPLTPSGKLDRRALPAPEQESAAYAAPRTPVEEVLAGIWAEVLGVERVGVEDGFFDLGGHSLLATQVVSRARRAFGVEVPLRALFDAPTVAGLAGRVEALRSAGSSTAPPVRRAPREGPLPLSFAQQRLWLVDRMEPGSAAYNMPYALRLRGALDVAALRAALDGVARRHEALRTTFAESGGGPVQVVHDPAPVPLPVVDLWGVRGAGREAERLAREEALRPFDLARGPLLRSALLRLGGEEHVLCFTLHHVVSDGWSRGVLVREVSALYAAFSRGEEPRLPELPVQYADFAAWQRARLRGEVLEAQIGYWKERLSGAPPLLEVPTDHPRAPGRSPLAASRDFRLSPEVSGRLRGVSRREGATLFMTLLAAWQALLSRYSGQDDVVVGTPIAGRAHRETEGLIGFFVNMLALRVDLSGDPTWRGLLGRVREAALGAYDHQELPFERLVEELGVERSLVHAPVFQAVFALELSGGEGGRLALGDVGVEAFGGGGGMGRFDLDLVFADSGGTLGGGLVYRRALFEEATAARMTEHLAIVLEAMAADPARRLSELSLLRPAERARVLHEWNDTASELPRACIHELFREQASRAAHAPAVLFRGEEVAYGELDRRSSRLAHLLRERGVRPETRVGVCMERGIDVAAALLGVLKAGGAYVPLDPSHPTERMREILADSGAALVLTHGGAGARLPAGAEALRLDDPETAARIAALPDAAPPVPSDPAQLAYVVYTSGSTGRPKGVAVSHASVVRLVRGTDYLPFGPAERIAQVSNLAFDAATFELWGALLNGGALVVIERGVTLAPAEFAAALREHEVGVLFVTTALFNRVAQDEPGAFATLRHLLFGGEAVDPRSVGRVLEAGAPERLLHVYGPTETTTYASWHRVRRVEPGAATVPIGRPLRNTTLYVLDGAGQPVPPGMPGELYVGGPGVARGYLGQAATTAERFVPDPFGDAGGRLYRTGDRVRWLAAGEVEYLGRTDAQVKIRGFRIEPGEVEAALLALPEVREAIVVVCTDAPGSKRLVAYVVSAEGEPSSGAAIRARLAARLPEYMVPGSVVTLPALPLNANGKVDRGALPVPAPEAAGFVAPRTQAEEVLAGIWADVLGVERVGVEENFFEAGGHSLLATQVVSRVRQAFGTELPLRALFEAPTVAGLAGRIAAPGGAGAGAAPPVRRVPRGGGDGLPLSFAQRRLWLVDRLQPGSAAYNMPFALRLRGALHVPALRAALDELARRHETLRTTFAEQAGGAPVQRIHPAAPVPLPVLDLRRLPGAGREAEAGRLAAREALLPFDLARGPLVRCTLLRLGEDDHVLCLTLHHVVSDGWSMGVLVREVSALYNASVRGEPSPLPEPPVQYADFALWQHEWLSGETLERQLAYWRERLAGAPPLLELPTGRPRPSVQRHRGRAHSVHVDAAAAGELRALGRRESVTTFMTLLAGFAVLLGRWSGQADVVVGTPVAGRNRRETEGLIGFFLNTLALRTDLGGDPTFREVLRRVREATLGAYDHQDLPFERILEELQPARSLSHSPVFQVMLNLQNLQDERPAALEGLRAERFGGASSSAKYDLTLYALEGAAGIDLELVYDADLFEDAPAAEALGHLRTLLGAVAADPELRVSEVPLLTPGERLARSARARGVETDRAFAEFARGEIEQTIPARFEAQARLHPDRLAVRSRGASLTYAELDRAAEAVAGAILRARPAGPERVALLFEHGAAMIVAILGVLKAGKTYVPVDPRYPRERSTYVLEDSGAAAVVTGGACLELARELSGGRLPLVDVEGAGAGGASAAAERRRPVDPGEPAYILYTSGSTGEPKGVVQSHRNVLHFIRVYTNNLRIGREDRLTLFSSYTFDASVMAVYGALLNGAALLPLDWREETAPGVAGWMRRERITLYHSTPTVFRHLVAGLAEEERFPDVRLVVLGGEETQSRDVEAFRAHFAPGAVLVNGLGPTESTVTLQNFIGRDTPTPRGSVPVGHPVEDTEVSLRNALGEQVAVYGVGEIEIRSPHVALGYWRKPAQTAAAFGEEPGGRVRSYRTGDLGRRLPDGKLEFVGRTDFQVKVRGVRVELGEVEAAMRAHPAVREAVAAARDDGAGERWLAAYAVAAEGAELPGAGELRAWLRERLPEHMVPAAFVALDSLPLTPSGKVDRLALPAPARGGSDAAVAPRTPTEEVLAEIWAEVLGLERVGTREDFFELGGHSLLATRVASRAREAFGVELPLRTLFESPTVAALAERVEEAGREGAPQAPPLVPVSRDGPLPLSFAQQRLWFLDRFEPGSAAYNLPYPVRVRGGLRVRVLERALQRVVQRQEALRTRFVVAGDGPVQRVEPAAAVRIPVVDLGGLGEAEREAETRRLVGDEARRPFDLAAGPPVRTVAVRLAADDAAVLFTLHHIVSDGWSTGILVREVSACYEAMSRGEEPRLPPLPVQYADYAAWQRSWLSGAVLESRLAYWRERLAGVPALLELPTDRPRPAVLNGAGAARPFRLPPGTLRGLRLLARREGATLFMALLSAWQVLLARYAGAEDVPVGTPIAGRTHVELEGVIGLFVNTLVLRGDLSGEPSFRELLGRVRDATLGAYQHQDVPFEKLVEELRVERSLDRTPLFQVMLTLQNTERGELVLGDLRLEGLEGGGSSVNADLSFTLREAGDALAGVLQYRTELFDPGTVDRHLEHLGVLLEGIVADPGRGIRELPLLSGAERVRVVAEWNDTGAAYPWRPVHELFDEQAERTPAAVAAVCGSGSLTYAELRRGADGVAAALRARGIGRGSCVPVLMDRGLDVPVAMLGVMKSGGAFSPLDVHWPVARLRAVLDDLGCEVVLVNGRTPFREEELGRALLRVDGGDVQGGAVRGEPAPVGPDDPIYAIYTSGSTGTPKAALVPHRGITNRFLWMNEYFGAGAAEAVVQTTRHVYDSAVWQLLWPLVNGGRTVLPGSDEELAAEPLAALVREHGATMTDFVPSVFNFLVPQLVGDGELRRALASLRVVVVGGEQITPATTYAFMRCFPEVRVVNLYGPTEASIGCICHEVTGAEGGRIPIGRPIRNTHALVLDGGRRPVPVGVPGELYLSGACLGLGYLNDAARTAEVFVDNAFPELGCERMYRTGDRARWLASGELEYLGRMDQQVKIRGFRIEPGEVEAALGTHPAVREAVVVAREDVPGDRRLAAYVVARAGADVAPAARGAPR